MGTSTHIINVGIVNQIPEMLIVNIRYGSRLEEFGKPKCVNCVVHGIDT
jgi:hypothetical protein